MISLMSAKKNQIQKQAARTSEEGDKIWLLLYSLDGQRAPGLSTWGT